MMVVAGVWECQMFPRPNSEEKLDAHDVENVGGAGVGEEGDEWDWVRERFGHYNRILPFSF